MSVSRISHWRGLVIRRSSQPSTRRYMHRGDSGNHRPSRHAHFYSDLVPAMVPVALLGSAVYMGLQLLQTCLAHEKYLDEARARVRDLEREIDVLILERRNPSSTPPPAGPAAHASNSKGWLGRLWQK